jgi:CheY-like chemotaxis protein
MHRTSKNLIVVEDEPLLAMMIENLVKDLGWTVEGSAYTEADAFIVLAECSPSLALLDINLELTTSLAVASACRDRHIPIVFMTGYTARDVPLQCGNAPILTKPFSTHDLQQAIGRAIS